MTISPQWVSVGIAAGSAMISASVWIGKLLFATKKELADAEKAILANTAAVHTMIRADFAAQQEKERGETRAQNEAMLSEMKDIAKTMSSLALRFERLDERVESICDASRG